MSAIEHAMLRRLTECGIPADEERVERLARYHALLVEWNTCMDLTAVTDEEDMLDRHYADSLSPMAIPGLIPEEGSLIDVGTGAGFPGLPLAIWLPQWRVTLLDSQQKRLNFLSAVVEELKLTNVKLVHARAEDAARQPALREGFDLAVARAVAPLPVLAEYLLPFVKVGGRALCWKGPGVTAEAEAARSAARLLGGRTDAFLPVTFPGREWQHLLVPIAKVASTNKKYPRKAGVPAKLPLGAGPGGAK